MGVCVYTHIYINTHTQTQVNIFLREKLQNVMLCLLSETMMNKAWILSSRNLKSKAEFLYLPRPSVMHPTGKFTHGTAYYILLDRST
jgi:hypothetical protein